MGSYKSGLLNSMKKKVLIIDSVCSEKGVINKDVNGGLGTRTQIGNTWRARLLEQIKKRGVVLPLLEYGYLSAVLKNKGYQVEYIKIIDINFIHEIKQYIDNGYSNLIFNPALVSYTTDIQIANRLKKMFPKIKMGAIGSFATILPEKIENVFDWIVCGETEPVLMSNELEDLHGIIRCDELVQDLDSLPFPDWRIFINQKFSYRPMLKKTPFFTILGSRGCPMSCSYYCPYPAIQGKRWRARSAENLVSEIQNLITNYGAKAVLFRDAFFSYSKKRTEKFAQLLINKKIKIEWACETRLDYFNKNLLRLLYRSGLRAINIGIESSDINILNQNKRQGIESTKQEDLISFCYKLGIKINAFFILGLEGDTEESIKRTLEYSKSLKLFAAQYTINTPLPGTQYFNDMQNKIFEDDLHNFDNNTLVFKHENLTANQLHQLKEKAFIGFYFRPKFFYEQIKWKIREMFL
jgi:anaerobic magnesium-protoporphyrin IX monomethyl ester cyclase